MHQQEMMGKCLAKNYKQTANKLRIKVNIKRNPRYLNANKFTVLQTQTTLNSNQTVISTTFFPLLTYYFNKLSSDLKGSSQDT